jgi:acetylornithine deacetylase
MDRTAIINEIKSSANNIAALTSEMIAIPSPTGQEGPMADWLAGWLKHEKFDIEMFEIDPESLAQKYPREFYKYNFPYEGRPNVVGQMKGSGGGQSLMINFHMDVVDADPNAWSTDPWAGTVKDGILYGRGACDMKGGAAAALFAVKSILNAGIRLKGDLLIAGVIEEEGPGNGTLALQSKGVRADGCLIPEPTELALCPCLTGGVYGIITTTGRSSHTTTYWEAENALEKSCWLLRGIEAWREKRRNMPLNLLYTYAPDTPAASPLINLVRTDGANIARVPQSVQLWTRATVMPGEDPHVVAAAMEQTILEIARQDPWLKENPPVFIWIVLGGRSYPAALPEKHPLADGLTASYRKVCGCPQQINGFVSPADMQQLLNIQPTTPTIMFGPGSIYTAHSDNECVPLNELADASAVIADFILDWCGVEAGI